MRTNKMKVEIWSDVTCPFCYIGKRNLENALSQFQDAAHVEIIWKSFELAPGLKTDPGKNMHRFLAKLKGISLEQSVAISDQVASTARQVGLEYNFHKTIPANSFNAHRFSHLAKHHHMQDQAKESLLEAYFTNGKNIDDIPTLISLGVDIGLDSTDVKKALEGSRYTDEVKQDIVEAMRRGITSVPAFLFNNSLFLSGAQDSKTFLEALEKAFTDWRLEKSESNPAEPEAQSCKIDGTCN